MNAIQQTFADATGFIVYIDRPNVSYVQLKSLVESEPPWLRVYHNGYWEACETKYKDTALLAMGDGLDELFSQYPGIGGNHGYYR